MCSVGIHCQLFQRYRREIFILGVLGFLKTTRPFPKVLEEVRSFFKTSEVFRLSLRVSTYFNRKRLIKCSFGKLNFHQDKHVGFEMVEPNRVVPWQTFLPPPPTPNNPPEVDIQQILTIASFGLCSLGVAFGFLTLSGLTRNSIMPRTLSQSLEGNLYGQWQNLTCARY